ncbi:MAG: Gldg family protein [Eubacteriales bacterium]
MNLLKKKNFRYGSLAVVLSAVVIAVIVVFNVIISSLASKYGWYFDMTSENLYEISDQSKEILSGVDASGNQVTIYFLTDKDRLGQGVTSADYYGESGFWGMAPIHELAKQLADNYSYISVDYINLNSDPDRIRAIVGDAYDDSSFAQTTVIVDNYTEYTDASGGVYDSSHNYRVYTRDSFYTYDYTTTTVAAFLGDYRFCSAICSVTTDPEQAPVAYFISGHGEGIGSYDRTDEDQSSIDYGSAQSLWQIFRDCGYEIRKIDLRYEDFEDGRDGVAVIYAPVSDYISKTSSDQFDEIAKLSAYLEKGNHSLMVFLDPKEGTLTNLEEFLEQTAGVTFVQKKLKDDGQNSVSVDGYSLVGQPVEDNAIISDLAKVYTEGEKTIFRTARPLTLTEGKGAVSLYQVPESVQTEGYTGAGVDSLLALTTTSAGGRILTCGTSLLVNGVYMDSHIYANHDLMLRILDEMVDSDRVSFGIPVKVIRNEGLDLTTHQANVLSAVMTVGLPLVFAIVGTIVYIRRRHS